MSNEPKRDERQAIDKQFETIGEFYKDAQHDGPKNEWPKGTWVREAADTLAKNTPAQEDGDVVERMQQYRSGNGPNGEPTPAQGRWVTLDSYHAALAEARRGYYRAEDLKPVVDALEELARLGNGEHYGNSTGNFIAQRALKVLARLAPERKEPSNG